MTLGKHARINFKSMLLAMGVSMVIALSLIGCSEPTDSNSDDAGAAGQAELSDGMIPEAESAVYFVPAEDMQTYAWGYIDATGGWVIEPKFAEANAFNESGLAKVSDSYTGLYGLIDTSGNWILEPNYKELYVHDLDYPILAEDASGQQGYVDLDTGEWIFGPSSDYRCDSFQNGLAFVTDANDSTIGCIDTTGNWAFDQKFVNASRFSKNGFAFAAVGKNSVDCEFGVIDKTGTWVVEPQFISNGYKPVFYDDGYAVVESQGSTLKSPISGVINESGETVIEMSFSGIGKTSYNHSTLFDENGFACAKADGLVGLIDKHGSWVVEPMYDAIEYEFNGMYSFDSSSDSVVGLYGYMNSAGEVIIEPQFNVSGYFFNPGDKAVVSDAEVGLYGVIDNNGNWLIEPQFSAIEGLANETDLAAAQDPNTELYGLINLSGEWVIEPQYQSLTWNNGAQLAVGCLPVGFGHWVLLDNAGEMISETRFSEIGSFQPVNVDQVTYWQRAAPTVESSSLGAGPSAEDFVGIPDYDYSGVTGRYVSEDGRAMIIAEDGTVHLDDTSGIYYSIYFDGEPYTLNGGYCWTGKSKNWALADFALYPVGVEITGAQSETPSDTSRVRLVVESNSSESGVYYLE